MAILVLTRLTLKHPIPLAARFGWARRSAVYADAGKPVKRVRNIAIGRRHGWLSQLPHDPATSPDHQEDEKNQGRQTGQAHEYQDSLTNNTYRFIHASPSPRLSPQVVE